MAEPSRRLGRGLSSLMSSGTGSRVGNQMDESRLSHGEASYPRDRHLAQVIPLRAIQPNPDQPRRLIRDESIASLAESIKRSGLIQPIVVRPIPGARKDLVSQGVVAQYELVAGERRWRAAHLAGLSDVLAIIRDASEDELLELALVENIHREDLNPIDRAMAYQQFTVRFSMTPDQIAERTGEDRSTVANYLRLLELPQEVRDMVTNNLLSMGHARALLGVPSEEDRLRLAKAVVIKNLSVRALEDAVRQQRPAPKSGSSAKNTAKTKGKRPLIRDMEQQFEEVLKTKVKIQEGRKHGRGKIVVEYNTLDDFDRICEAIGLKP